jgi:glycosyltransferase involved in cell wall biosynthesis
MSSPTVLFISNEASYTGAPRVLYELLVWLRANTNVVPVIVLRRGGPLQYQLQRLATTLIYTEPHHWKAGRLMRSLLARRWDKTLGRIRLTTTWRSWLAKNVRLVYCNTMANGDVLELLSYLKCPMVTACYEMDYSVEFFQHTFAPFGVDTMKTYARATTQYIAASRAVKDSLMNRYQVPGAKIDVVNPPLRALGQDAEQLAEAGRRMRVQLNIPRDAFVVGGCGTLTWVKGVDLFIQMAAKLRGLLPDRPLAFVWLGRHVLISGAFDRGHLFHDAGRLGVGGAFRLIDYVDNSFELFAAFDVFALTSRVDSFPLVMLEAGALAKPVVCFASAGGAPEFVEDDCGFVVPYLDTLAMAQRIATLAHKDELRARLGHRAADKAHQRCDVSVVIPRLYDVMRRFL